MTLKEAIPILTKYRKDHHSFPTDIIGKAEQLGIEALQYVEDTRLTYNGVPLQLLPSETKD